MPQERPQEQSQERPQQEAPKRYRRSLASLADRVESVALSKYLGVDSDGEGSEDSRETGEQDEAGTPSTRVADLDARGFFSCGEDSGDSESDCTMRTAAGRKARVSFAKTKPRRSQPQAGGHCGHEGPVATPLAVQLRAEVKRRSLGRSSTIAPKAAAVESSEEDAFAERPTPLGRPSGPRANLTPVAEPGETPFRDRLIVRPLGVAASGKEYLVERPKPAAAPPLLPRATPRPTQLQF